jgi:hypothetical protein
MMHDRPPTKEAFGLSTTDADSVAKPAPGLTTRGRALIHSYTSLNCYDSICPHQYQHRYILKDIPFKETPAMAHGTAVHSAMEKRIAGGKPLPETMRQWEPLAKPFADRGAKAEMKLALGYAGEPVDFWGKPFIRGKLDCVLLNGTRAYMADWKTGKPREDPFELQVGAMLLKAAYPNLQTIVGTYVWLKENDLGRVHDLSDTQAAWRKCNNIAEDIDHDRTFEKRPGPLCSWCDVLSCEHNRKPR